jgi:aminoglycoside phosphotransferase (APT) family kinase protein
MVPSALRDAAPRIIAARDRLEAAWAAGSLTLIHGDAHVGNMYFTGSNVGLLDWQVVQCGQGMRDVTYFLANSVPTELRRAHERELIGAYLAHLADLGVAAPDPGTAWEQYRLHAAYAWFAAAVTAAAETLQSAPIVRAGLVRTSTAMMDLASVDAVTRL